MGIRDLFGEKQAMAGDGPGGIVVRFREFSGDPEAREGREGHGDLIRFQICASQVPPSGKSVGLVVNLSLPGYKQVGKKQVVTHRRRMLDSTRRRSRTQPV